MDSETGAGAIAGDITADAFSYVEKAVYAVLGVLLSVTALVALGSAGTHLFNALRDWNTSTTILAVIERLLLVFMLIEILHTVRASVQSRTLTCEPFLVVALIASVRRMLVITLQSAEAAHDVAWTVEREIMFRATMLERTVLGGLTLVTVVSIFMLRRGRPQARPRTAPLNHRSVRDDETSS
nr:phosphate-starvation-inducible PsiE family protein [uncultured Rhodopila sp.]